MNKKLVVGLANPGIKYSLTRHNAGAWYVSLLAQRFHTSLHETPKFYGLTSHIIVNNINVYLLIPTTFMNLSGKAVIEMVNFYHINDGEILIAHDELNLPPGTITLRSCTSHGGHNGLKDIINKLNNTRKFHQLRIGIGHPGNKNKVVDFVLNPPSLFEKKLINSVINEAVSCTEIWLKEGLSQAANRLHTFKVRKLYAST